MFDSFLANIQYFIAAYAILVTFSYGIQALSASVLINKYVNRKKNLDETTMLQSHYLPSMALVAPAFNESVVVTQSVRSLLTVHYFNLEIIVVNDGSTDDTLAKLIKEFSLEKKEIVSYHSITTQPVRGLYKSTKPAYKNLTVVDKVNGRKADAINVGINHSLADYYAVIDLDCLLEPNALLMMVEPILQSSEKKVVAVGGVIGAANDSEVMKGKFLTAKTPKNFFAKTQIVEYVRAFIFGRTSWNSFNGMMLISGALGLFERETLIAVDGFSPAAVGEDMDLVMKMHRYCKEKRIPYKIDFVPYPLCWTEVPEDPVILASQRNRWMRGTIECMIKFRKMCLNPKYGVIGMISYPYWLFGEMLAPLLEFFGLFFIIFLASQGIVNWAFALSIVILLYLLALINSISALMVYYINFKKYATFSDLLGLFLTAAIEPFIYHPRCVWWGLKGHWDFFIRKKKGWGIMRRVGFNSETA